MNTPKSVRIAAIVSQAVLVLWILLTVLSNVFQERIALLYYRYPSSDWERSFSWTVIAMCIADLLITAANLQICRGKGRVAPLVTAAVTTGALPIVCSILQICQSNYAALLWGDDELARAHLAIQTAESLCCFLYAGAIITIAAAAVYAFAKKETAAKQLIEASDYAPPYNI